MEAKTKQRERGDQVAKIEKVEGGDEGDGAAREQSVRLQPPAPFEPTYVNAFGCPCGPPNPARDDRLRFWISLFVAVILTSPLGALLGTIIVMAMMAGK